MTALLLTAAGLGVLGLALYACYHAGKSDQKARELDEHLSSGRRAFLARDRLRRDPGYARRVRDRFTR